MTLLVVPLPALPPNVNPSKEGLWLTVKTAYATKILEILKQSAANRLLRDVKRQRRKKVSRERRRWRSKKSRFYDHDYCLSPSHVPKLTSFHRISPIIDHASQHGSSTSGYIRSRKRCQNLQCGPLLNEHFHRQSYTIGQLVQKALGILFAKGIDQEMEFSKL
ncbi:hypothetical protein PSHT_12117 [Puccinia striiformis]|uniref:Uncharacterized protein n=1 Tax=Puccinia striiformis TaxID=27350 RepID=A0A2S4UYY3_9BASI|nr:hypothetical protein PSHT_12117 [Puccinia striiformis]